MNNEIIEKYFIANGDILPVESFDSFGSGTGPSIYEVVRVIDGVPLFLEKHMSRLSASARMLGYNTDALAGRIEDSMHRLIEANGSPDKNLKLTVYNMSQPQPEYLVYFIKSSYPSPEEYQKGVPAILYHAERSNPNAKVINLSFKEKVALRLEETGAYEALLVNEQGEITEGSRSNLFFAKDGRLYTSPGGAVLIGVTRTAIFDICSTLNIEIVEKPVSVSFLEEAQGLFITGTSPRVLPISSVDGRKFDSAGNAIIQRVMGEYSRLMDEYIKAKKTAGI